MYAALTVISTNLILETLFLIHKKEKELTLKFIILVLGQIILSKKESHNI